MNAEQNQINRQQPIQIINTYPQFQLHGRPFFAHSTAFFYNRIPRDEWGPSLAKLKEMGINTVDLYLAWNWHEPEEGKLDFDGRTNPRRDVKSLLAMIDEMGFAVIARPGPVILNEWRNGGYPDWLLARPEFQMNEVARLDGHYPPLSAVNPVNSEEAGKQWLANETHLRYTKKWFGEVMRELLKDRQSTNAKGDGNLIAIQLDDDQAINRVNYNGPIFWKYMNTLGGYLREAGATVPLYINPTDMRVSAAGAPHSIGAMGQWYFNFGSDPALRWEDSATLQFFTETLKTQPHFPPMMIEYQAGWYGTGDDTYAKTADPTNTLLSSRLMIGHGLQGLNYFPVQDTLYPAGYEVPWANHYYIWESALNLNREERPRASAVHRNGRLIAGLGGELASAHKAADIGLIYPISSFDQPALTRDDVMRISRAEMQIQQFCQLNQMAVEYIDLEFQPLEHLKRHKALLLPVFDEAILKQLAAVGREEVSAGNEPLGRRGEEVKGGRGERLRLSEVAQRKLVEFVKAGGTLVCTPAVPQGELLKAIANDPRVIVVPDFWKTIPIEPGKAKREEVIATVQSSAVEFVSKLARSGINRRVKARVTTENGKPSGGEAVGASIEPDFIATQLVSGPGLKASGFISAVNFDSRKTMRVSLSVADPHSIDASSLPASRILLPEFSLRPRDAMLLPVRLPLLSPGQGEPAKKALAISSTIQTEREEILYATAELISREMVNGKISMRFYAPSPAEIALSLPRAPQGAVICDGALAVANYDASKKLLTIRIPASKPRKAEDLSNRREHERDVEIIYEKGVSEVGINTTRLIIGEDNQVGVQVSNRRAERLSGELHLSIESGFKVKQLKLNVDLKPQEVKRFDFAVPLSAKAVERDRVVLRAMLATGKADERLFSPAVSAEVMKPFGWRIYPKVTWPLRADTLQELNPPLIYPGDDKATEASFNLRMYGYRAEGVTLSRTSLLVNSMPLKLKPDEEFLSTYTFSFVPNEKSVINPFVVKMTDGRTTEQVKVNFVALRKGEAVAFAYDIDRDGFDDYVMENEYLRLIISPRAGGRAFALINKQTGANVFNSVGGLRDKFVELDPADPTRNPRRKRGMYGAFNRPYVAEIVEGMGKQVILQLSCFAADIYPAGARIERAVILKAGDEFFTVDYRVTPNPRTVDGKQAFWSSNSIVIGDPANKARRFSSAEGLFDFAALKMRELNVAGGWIAAPVAERTTFAVLWRPEQVKTAEVEMKEFSSLVNVKFKPFAATSETGGAHAYRLAFYLGQTPPERINAERARMLGQ